MEKPNLFKYATKELSQDAFICWLLAWADKAYEEHEEHELHQVGMRFLQSLLAKKPDALLQVNSFEIKQQHQKIDILVFVNTTLKQVKDSKQNPPKNSGVIIIEDKVRAGLRKNQLKDYYKIVKDLGFSDEQIVPIYFRTQDKLDLSNIKANGYEPYMREEFLKVLNTYKGSNQIIADFTAYWGKKEAAKNSYKTVEVKDWNNDSWLGLYQDLREHLHEGDNGLNNEFNSKSRPTFGPLFEQKKLNCDLFIQLRTTELIFIVKANYEDKQLIKELRASWKKALVKKEIVGFGEIAEAARIDFTREMKIGHIDNYLAQKDGMVDVENTLLNLRKIEQFVKALEIK